MYTGVAKVSPEVDTGPHPTKRRKKYIDYTNRSFKREAYIIMEVEGAAGTEPIVVTVTG